MLQHFIWGPLLPASAQIQAAIVAAAPQLRGAGRKKHLQEDVLTPEQLRAIWKGGVYVPPPAPPERVPNRATSPAARLEISRGAPKPRLPDAVAELIALRGLAHDFGAARDIEAEIDILIAQEATVSAILTAIVQHLLDREDDDLTVLLLSA